MARLHVNLASAGGVSVFKVGVSASGCACGGAAGRDASVDKPKAYELEPYVHQALQTQICMFITLCYIGFRCLNRITHH